MKRQILLVLLPIFCSQVSLGQSIEEGRFDTSAYDNTLTFANAVQKRFYVIRRLGGSVERLLGYYQELCCEQCVRETEQRKCSLERELFQVRSFWHDCLAYKHIMSDTHTRELLVHLIVLYEALLKIDGNGVSFVLQQKHECSASDDFLQKDPIKRLSKQGIDELLDRVDALVATGRGLLSQKPHGLTAPLLPEFNDEYLFGQNDVHESDEASWQALDASLLKQGDFLLHTTLRFYVVQRLAGPMEQLAKQALSKDAVLCVCALLPSLEKLQSRVMRDCVQKMCTQGSLQPLFMLWDSIGSYRYIGEPYLIRELLLIVVQVYQLIMKAVAPQLEQNEIQEEHVLDVYSSIASLPLPELLLLLDDLTQQSASVVSVYQQGVAQGWKAVVKEYWWVPPIMLAGCASLCLRMKRFFGQSHYRDSLFKVPREDGQVVLRMSPA